MSVASEYLQLSRESADELVRRHAPLVRRIAYHLMGRLPASVDVGDLIQAGMIGLLEAARHFALDRGASFETYAGIRIRGAMLDELRRTDWTPRSVHRKTREVAEVIRQIETETGAEAEDAEVMRRLGISAEEYHQVLADAACVRLLSLTASVPIEGISPERMGAAGRHRPLDRIGDGGRIGQKRRRHQRHQHHGQEQQQARRARRGADGAGQGLEQRAAHAVRTRGSRRK